MLAFPKANAVRSRPYRMYVASLPCFACGMSGRSQAAHSNSPQHGKGGRLKADDRFVFPLCTTSSFKVGCHEQHDQLIDMDRETRRELEERYVARMQARAVADGWDIQKLRRTR